MNELQKTALKKCCDRFDAPFAVEHYHPGFGIPDGWVEGWIGGEAGKHIYVGCSPKGEIHS